MELTNFDDWYDENQVELEELYVVLLFDREKLEKSEDFSFSDTAEIEWEDYLIDKYEDYLAGE